MEIIMGEFIFKPKAEVDQTESDVAYYTMLGNQDYLDKNGNPRLNKESSKVFAKSIKGAESTRYYIKTGTYGKIYNPIGLFSEGRHNRFMAKIGKKEYDFKEVNPKVFSLYTNFLRTKNLAWLNNAEREMA